MLAISQWIFGKTGSSGIRALDHARANRRRTRQGGGGSPHPRLVDRADRAIFVGLHAGARHLRASRAGWRPTIDNFVALWSKWGDFFAGLANSLIITAGATLLAVPVSTLAGFGYSRWRGRFLSGSAFALIALRLLPPIVTTLPLFPIVNALRLQRHAHGADHSLRGVLRFARHHGDAHLHRPDPARAR